MSDRLFLLGLIIFLTACTAEPKPIVVLPAPLAPKSTAVLPPSKVPSPVHTPTAVAPAQRPNPPPPDEAILEGEAAVVFVKDGNMQLWQAATGQSHTLVDSGDVDGVWLSPDGQKIVYTRRSIVVDPAEVNAWHEEYALWLSASDGTNDQELVAGEVLRELLHIGEGASTGIAQLAWLTDNRTVIFSAVEYWVQAEGLSHAVPEGIFRVDTQSQEISILVPDDQNASFVPSADGHRLALMSTTGLSFINTDGSGLTSNIHTYPQVGVPISIFPNGVWTEDSSAFILAAPTESDSDFIINYNVWRVPADGSPAEVVVSDINDSHAVSFAFSPDGRFTGFLQGAGEYFIRPLSHQTGPLHLFYRVDEFFYPNLHWSPANIAYVKEEDTLNPLCPDATRDTERCGKSIQTPGNIHALQWLDDGRFLLMTREPYALYLVHLDGTTRPIVSWQPEEWVSARSFSAPRATIAVSSPPATSPPDTLSFRQKNLILLNINTGRPLGKLEGFGGEVRAAAFDPNGRFLATVTPDNIIRLWQIPGIIP